MPHAPTTKRTRLAAAAGLLGGSAVAALLVGIGPVPSAMQLAGATSDDTTADLSGNCDEVEHATDPACVGTPTSSADDESADDDDDDGTTTTIGDDATATPADGIHTLDAAGAGTVIYAVESGNLRLVSATPTSGWQVEVEQGTGRNVERFGQDLGHDSTLSARSARLRGLQHHE